MGAGAVGGHFGGVLARSGEDVTFVARGQHLAAINGHGLRVESVAAGDFTVHAPGVERPDGTWKADLALLCVKSYDNREAIETMEPAVGESTTVLTLQNGIGSGDELAHAFGREKVMLGAAYIEAMRKGPGVVAQGGGPCRIVFGEADGRATPRALEIRDTFQRAGIDVQLSTNVHGELWNKLIFICALSGMTCIARAPLAQVLDTPETLDLAREVMREAANVGKAKGVDLEEGVVEATMDNLIKFRHDLTSSMYLDLEAGNPLEVGVLNGAVSKAGKEVGIPTPANDFITTCLAVADRGARARRSLAASS